MILVFKNGGLCLYLCLLAGVPVPFKIVIFPSTQIRVRLMDFAICSTETAFQIRAVTRDNTTQPNN